MIILGLMSGTSADGIDAVLVEFSGNPNRPDWTILNSFFLPYPQDIRRLVIEVGQGSKLSSQEWMELSEKITELNANAALGCDISRKAQFVGCHGQTVWHRPPLPGRMGGSMQILRAPLLAKLLNRPIVSDFRFNDILLGGNGAPLVPLVDEALIGRIGGWRGILNLGGISNLTLIPPLQGPHSSFPVMGWDSGPANTLLDLAVQEAEVSGLDFDENGCIAAKGLAMINYVDEWLKEPYFQKSPPKSTGREQFGLVDLRRRKSQLGNISLEDLLATLTSFTAATIAQDLYKFKNDRKISLVELLVAGGGSNNKTLFDEIRNRCRGIWIRDISEIGISSQLREALAFATLTWWNTLNKRVNAKSVTGSRRPVLLGVCIEPP